MPNCKYCGARIDKFNKDMCPICGNKNPLEGTTSNTVEITSQIDLSNVEFKNYKIHLRAIAFLLFILIGWTGAPYFYLGFKKKGIIWAVINILLIAGLGSILAFVTPLGVFYGYIIPVSIIYLINICFGLYYLAKSDLKDGNGEFIR